MYWVLRKTKDDEQSIEYSYGCESNAASGIIKYDKATQESTCIKLAEGDTGKGVVSLLNHIWKLVNKENAPDKKTIAIG